MEIRKSSVYNFNGIYNNYVIIRQTFKFLIENLPDFKLAVFYAGAWIESIEILFIQIFVNKS